MKTSNKLIIACAILVIAIPIMLMAYQRSRFFEEYEKEIPTDTYSRNTASFSQKIANRVAYNTPAFDRVEIIGEQEYYSRANITLNQSASYGITINKPYRHLVTHKIENRTLKIIVNKAVSSNELYVKPYVSIYSPTLNAVNVKNASVNLSAKQNQLNLTGTNASLYLNFIKEDGEVNFLSIDTLNVWLTRSSFSTSAAYERLSIQSKNNSFVTLLDKDKKANVKNFNYKSIGINGLEIKDYHIGKFTGNISPQTKTEIPAELLQKLNK